VEHQRRVEMALQPNQVMAERELHSTFLVRDHPLCMHLAVAADSVMPSMFRLLQERVGQTVEMQNMVMEQLGQSIKE
jgi:hypothetical protein